MPDDTTAPCGWRIQPAYLSAADLVRLAELAEELDLLLRGDSRGADQVPLASMGQVAGYLLRGALRRPLPELAAEMRAALGKR